MNNKCPIAIVINNNYTMQASVTIASIIENKNVDTIYSINIITDFIEEENKAKLCSMATDTVEICIHELGIKYDNLTNYTRWPNIIFYKFDVPYVLKQYDKIILLDADTIVLKDLTEMYNIYLNSNYAGVVDDITRILKDDEFTKQINKYFNIGVILLNAKKIREQFNLNDIIECYKKNAKLFISPEQDTLNYLFKDNLKYIHPKYQYITLYNNYTKSNFLNFHKILNKDEISYKNLVILHYAQMQPWKYWNIKYQKDWFKYYKLSPYYINYKYQFYNIFFDLYRKIRYNYRFFKFQNKLKQMRNI